MAMCLRCTNETAYILCDRCYETERAYIKAIDTALAAGVPVDAGTIRNGERARRWCEERDRRYSELLWNTETR